MKNSFFIEFKGKHPIIYNALLIFITFCAICYAALMLIDVFTAHGQEKKVPNVCNMTLDQAVEALEEAGFKWEISDSTFNETIKPGTVLSQDPKAGSYVKALRTIYLNINSFYPRAVALPVLTEISVRQGLSMLKSLGFKNVGVDTVPSPYEGLILAVNVNGRQVKPGTRISVNSMIRLSVGNGEEDLDPTQVLPESTLDSLQEVQRLKAQKEAREREKAEANRQSEPEPVPSLHE